MKRLPLTISLMFLCPVLGLVAGGCAKDQHKDEMSVRDGKPSTEFAYKNDELEKTMNDALAATDENTAKTLWEHAQDLLKADLPTVPLINSTPPAAAQAYVKDFVGSGGLNEYLNSVWLDK